jgi:hypothetical protein
VALARASDGSGAPSTRVLLLHSSRATTAFIKRLPLLPCYSPRSVPLSASEGTASSAERKSLFLSV